MDKDKTERSAAELTAMVQAQYADVTGGSFLFHVQETDETGPVDGECHFSSESCEITFHSPALGHELTLRQEQGRLSAIYLNNTYEIGKADSDAPIGTLCRLPGLLAEALKQSTPKIKDGDTSYALSNADADALLTIDGNTLAPVSLKYDTGGTITEILISNFAKELLEEDQNGVSKQPNMGRSES